MSQEPDTFLLTTIGDSAPLKNIKVPVENDDKKNKENKKELITVSIPPVQKPQEKIEEPKKIEKTTTVTKLPAPTNKPQKKEEKSTQPGLGSKKENKVLSSTTTSKFPSVNNPNNRGQQSQNSQSRQTRSQTAMANNTKLDTLYSIIEEIKAVKKEGRTEHTADALTNKYNRMIVQNFDQLYNSDDPNLIKRELRHLEKNKFLQGEIRYKETEYQQNKKKLNEITYDIKQKEQQIKFLEKQIEDITSQLPDERIFDDYKDLKELVVKEQGILEDVKFQTNSLTFMLEKRKKLVLFIKKRCTQNNEIIKYLDSQKELHDHALSKRKEKNFELEKMFSTIRGPTSSVQEKLGYRLSEMLNDELSEFEETRAMKEIFKHEEELERKKEQQEEEKRKALLQKQKMERDKANEKTRRERRREEEALRELKSSFDELRKVTSLRDIKQAPTLKGTFEEGKEIMEKLGVEYTEEIDKIKEEISALSSDINCLKYQPKSNSDEAATKKYDDLEKEALSKSNKFSDVEKTVQRLEKVVDEVRTGVSRILYQLQGKGGKTKNVEVGREEVVNQLSVCGLKLERYLTILYKKKRNFRIVSINTDNNYESPPDFIGINPDIKADFEADNIVELGDEYLLKKEDDLDPEEKENEEHITELRKEIKNGKVEKIVPKVKEQFKEDKIKLKYFS